MNKEDRIAFITTHGYKNVTKFSEAVHEDVSNVHKILGGQQLPRIEKLFTYAAALDVDITKLLSLSYPEDMKRYKEARRQRKEGSK